MRTPDEIKKGLECCMFDDEGMRNCDECPYINDGCIYDKLNKDAIAYIQQLEDERWELFDLLSSVWYGKQYYFKQNDGKVYSRESCDYLSLEQAIDEFAHALTVASDINVPTTQPKWISVEERLPEDAQRVAAIAKNGMTGIMDYKADGTPFAARIFGICFSEIIWWMPLPEPPVTTES